MNYWLFVDFDGTFRNGPNKTVKQDDFEWIKSFQKAGNKICIATGRNFNSISKYIHNVLNFYPDYFVTTTGAVTVDGNGKVYSCINLNEKDKITILKYLETIKDELATIIVDQEKDENYLFKTDAVSEEQQKLFMIENNFNQDIPFLFDKEVSCLKMLCKKETWKKINDFIKENNLSVQTVTNNLVDLNMSEIHQLGVTKALGIRKLQEHFNFKDEQVIVAGDDDNDIPMLKEFENSFIVKQPYNEKIRSNATYEIDSIFQIQQYIK